MKDGPIIRTGTLQAREESAWSIGPLDLRGEIIMENDVTIRPAGRKDLPKILDLYSQPEMDGGRVLPIEAAEKVFEQMQKYPVYDVFVAELDDVVVGTFTLLIMDNLAHMGAPSAIIEDVNVAPAWQGQGIGTRIMEFAMDRARKAGCYKLVLSSARDRVDPHRFYRKLGFSQHGISFEVPL